MRAILAPMKKWSDTTLVYVINSSQNTPMTGHDYNIDLKGALRGIPVTAFR